MNSNPIFAVISAAFCLTGAPAFAQEIEADETVSVEREIMVIETDDEIAEETDDTIRRIRIRRLYEDTRDPRLDRQIDALKRSEVRILEMGDEADISEAELRAITEERIADGDMVIFSGREMRCERRSYGAVELRPCTAEGQRSALRALRKARAALAAQGGIGYESRTGALAALDRQIAELEVATGR